MRPHFSFGFPRSLSLLDLEFVEKECGSLREGVSLGRHEADADANSRILQRIAAARGA